MPLSSKSDASTNANCINKRNGTKQRKFVSPPVPPGSDAQFKVWWDYWEARSLQHRHQVACWRSQVDSLEYENRMLHEYIVKLLTGSTGSHPRVASVNSDQGFASPTSSQRSKRNRKRRNRRKRKAKYKPHQSNESDSETCSDYDEELLAFVEKSIRHRLERDNHPLLEKFKEKTGDQKVEPESLLQPQEMLVRNQLEEMVELFGPAAPKLLAMETAMQLTFNSNCDRHHPKLWPVLPLAL